MTIETTLEMGQKVIFYDPNNCRIIPGTITGISYYQQDSLRKETYFIRPYGAYGVTMSTGPVPIDFIFRHKDEVLDFCCKLMKDVEELNL